MSNRYWCSRAGVVLPHEFRATTNSFNFVVVLNPWGDATFDNTDLQPRSADRGLASKTHPMLWGA
jgi:hypothetical protein